MTEAVTTAPCNPGIQARPGCLALHAGLAAARLGFSVAVSRPVNHIIDNSRLGVWPLVAVGDQSGNDEGSRQNRYKGG